MPTYDFLCPTGHDFEKFYRSIAAAPTEVPCPICGKPAIRQMSAGAGLVFKGSGFYITDYGKDGKKDQKSAPKSAASSSSSKTSDSKASDSAASDSKPADSKPTSGASGSSAPASPKGSE